MKEKAFLRVGPRYDPGQVMRRLCHAEVGRHLEKVSGSAYF
jgi:hypothetical protein